MHILGFMGYLGAWNENWVCLSAYSTLAAIFFLLEIWFSTLAFLFHHEVTFQEEFNFKTGQQINHRAIDCTLNDIVLLQWMQFYKELLIVWIWTPDIWTFSLDCRGRVVSIPAVPINVPRCGYRKKGLGLGTGIWNFHFPLKVFDWFWPFPKKGFIFSRALG